MRRELALCGSWELVAVSRGSIVTDGENTFYRLFLLV